MRIVSMSTHAQLQSKKNFLEKYNEEIKAILTELEPEKEDSKIITGKKNLILIIGSQKGLCGAFNNKLLSFFKKDIALYPKDFSNRIVTVGKKISDYFNHHNMEKFGSYDEFGVNNFTKLSRKIMSLILETGKRYDSIVIYSNYPKSFFLQKSIKTVIVIPKKDVSKKAQQVYEEKIENGQFYEESKESLLTYAKELYLKAQLEQLMFQSLVAEQAARFVSMDASTQNAEKLIDEMKLDYNKLRQASITSELIDLVSGLL